MTRSIARTIAMFDTSQGTLNQGDFIIAEAINREMAYLTNRNVVLRFPTHSPLARGYQALFGDVRSEFSGYDLKFLCGTNLFKATLLRPNRDWNIGVLDSTLYKGSISLGCGMEVNVSKSDPITKHVYRKILSGDYVHSTRDERTARFLRSLGLSAINTGCPTTWGLTQEKVDEAFSRRSDTVLMTLTDYARNEERDVELFRLLRRLYKHVVLWPQGSEDCAYIDALGISGDVEMLPPSFEAYRKFQTKEFEYVGTRLHGGIYALSHGHRAIILSVDHRSTDMAATTGLRVIPRSDINIIEREIREGKPPVINIPIDDIRSWKRQFLDYANLND